MAAVSISTHWENGIPTPVAIYSSTDTNSESEQSATYFGESETSTSTSDTWSPPTTSTTSESVATATIISTPTLSSTTETSSSTSSATTKATSTSGPGSYSGSGESTKTKLAIALPISIVGVLAIIAFVVFFLRRRKRRNAAPEFASANGQATDRSTSQLMTAVPNITTPEPTAAALPRLSFIDVPPIPHSQDITPGSASARSDIDPNTELGVAVAIPGDDLRGPMERNPPDHARSESAAGATTGAGVTSVRLPFQNRTSEDEDDVSIISGMLGRRQGEGDFDDMSSVSSFGEEDSRTNNHGQSFR
ncbi:hypothetical protein N7462_006136 [Penicillium macrosclerotiorum]|uniref:uncharacterized protein n=1 Tax=Penicillium macrosclerotiorum TaxID=303699 RepID=UPI0025490325|nr:uncharacterized protein N7462_006136 [Penicillium macrosclerotiorum]KAJ5682971.1 hypothetical protein N7462_006136 [Penicillium macrosclerotiorum]